MMKGKDFRFGILWINQIRRRDIDCLPRDRQINRCLSLGFLNLFQDSIEFLKMSIATIVCPCQNDRDDTSRHVANGSPDVAFSAFHSFLMMPTLPRRKAAGKRGAEVVEDFGSFKISDSKSQIFLFSNFSTFPFKTSTPNVTEVDSPNCRIRREIFARKPMKPFTLAASFLVGYFGFKDLKIKSYQRLGILVVIYGCLYCSRSYDTYFFVCVLYYCFVTEKIETLKPFRSRLLYFTFQVIKKRYFKSPSHSIAKDPSTCIFSIKLWKVP